MVELKNTMQHSDFDVAIVDEHLNLKIKHDIMQIG